MTMELEVRLRRVRRWLERLTRAVELSMWDSAAAESQCLEAEVKSLREHLWRTAGASSPSRSSLRPFALGAALGLSILLAAGEPVSIGEVVSGGPGALRGVSQEPAARVFKEEPADAPRREVKEVPSPVAAVRPAEAEDRGEIPKRSAASRGKVQVKKVPRPEGVFSKGGALGASGAESGASVSLEEALMLLKTGQRALEGQ
ncbi:MAG: hypothetical protein N2315_09025 [Thermanaerothrix sp.]|nr:hypothetical protein [Thermanaerothrix sp.]